MQAFALGAMRHDPHALSATGAIAAADVWPRRTGTPPARATAPQGLGGPNRVLRGNGREETARILITAQNDDGAEIGWQRESVRWLDRLAVAYSGVDLGRRFLEPTLQPCGPDRGEKLSKSPGTFVKSEKRALVDERFCDGAGQHEVEAATTAER